jgi:two-component system response regulator FixJ
MKGGAFDFVEKPYDDELVIARVREALNKQRRTEESVRAKKQALAAIDRLTPRELEVFGHLVNGHQNKVIAYEMGISPRTVEIHRARVMEKLEAHSLSEVVHIAVAAGFEGGAAGEA